MNPKEEIIFDKHLDEHDISSLEGCGDDPVSPATSDQLAHDSMMNDVIVNSSSGQLTADSIKRKLTDSPNTDDTDGDALCPRKQLHINHHNNNDVSFVLIDDDGGGGTGPEDLASGDEEV